MNDNKVQGIVTGITFSNPDDGYTIAQLTTTENGTVCVIFNLRVKKGQKLTVTGFWKNHPRYGQQFQAQTWEEEKPTTLLGIERYLGDGQIPGIGPGLAKKIVAYFGEQTLDIIEHQVERITEVPGIGKKKAAQIQAVWREQKTIRDIMVFLRGHDISPVYASKILKKYGDDAIKIVVQNPYRLVEIHGIGFRKADEIARNLGMPFDSVLRYQAGLLYSLEEAAKEGHCFLPEPHLLKKAAEILTVDKFCPPQAQLYQAALQLLNQEKLTIESVQGHILWYQPALHTCEKNLADYLLMLLARPVAFDRTTLDLSGLTDQQQAAVQMAATCRVGILTGGPGTGKTFTTQTIVNLWQQQGKKIALASPTGRAAKRLSEMTGMPAKTIHRLLEFGIGGFNRNRQNPLNVDAIIIDEASMMDLPLAYALVRAIPSSAQLLLVGDSDQLPSVGPGRVLNDLIGSGQIPVVRLTEIFRQAAGSAIIVNAHRINQKHPPQLEPFSSSPRTDCLWLNAQAPQVGCQYIKQLLMEFLPAQDWDPIADVQILCPGRKNEMGTTSLNKMVQHLLNPADPTRPEITSPFGVLFRTGDRIIQTVNDYEKEVFNGDLGMVESVELEEGRKKLIASFDGRLVTYEQSELAELALAYAITIHKSQGSEYPVIILPLYTQHYILLNKNLLYTGLTRARKLAILVGQEKALALAVQNVQENRRYTLLNQRVNF
ncbi:ATP-dependent RecD-like DNA helicase [Laspinema sp. D1]|uniref:SF1B family DNA helicase RecD2 n=1 Tax=Laspinema palackyanum TaxID=3231601 RepID=UPI0034908C16|nr:ATP-dependent RecD-like DNA helicase [Laspinema sp. D2b]